MSDEGLTRNNLRELDRAAAAAAIYQVTRVEIVPPGTIGVVHTIPVPGELLRRWFVADFGPMSTLQARLGTDPRSGSTYAIGADGWSIVSTAPIVAGVEHRLSVYIDVAGRGKGPLAYTVVITGKVLP